MTLGGKHEALNRYNVTVKLQFNGIEAENWNDAIKYVERMKLMSKIGNLNELEDILAVDA